MLTLKILDANGAVLYEKSGDEICAVYNNKYNKGDYIDILCPNCDFLNVKIADSLSESIIYVPGNVFRYKIPHTEKQSVYPTGTFDGNVNIIKVSEASDTSVYSYRNIALNSAALRYSEDYYPYAKANFVTRDEVSFEERNSIDGIIFQDSHGHYPYQSYAGGAREDIEYYLYFGKEVSIDRIVFYLRADFKDDHDTYWKSLEIEFSNGTKQPVEFVKSNKGQEIILPEKKETSFIHLTNFKQASTPLSWAALSQIQVFGNYIK